MLSVSIAIITANGVVHNALSLPTNNSDEAMLHILAFLSAIYPQVNLEDVSVVIVDENNKTVFNTGFKERRRIEYFN